VDGGGHPVRLWPVDWSPDPLVNACLGRAVLDSVVPDAGRSRMIPLDVSANTAHAYVSLSSWTTVLQLSTVDARALDAALGAHAPEILDHCYAPLLRRDRTARGTDTLEVQVGAGTVTSARPTDVVFAGAADCAARLLAGTPLPKWHGDLPAHFPVDVDLHPAY